MKPKHTKKDEGSHRMDFCRKSFTLIELLIVIAIIAILAGMLLPALNKAKQTAQSISCTGNLKSFGSAAQQYAADFGDYIVPSTAPSGQFNSFFWKVSLAPYLGIKRQAPDWSSQGDHNIWFSLLTRQKIFDCPTEKSARTTSINGNLTSYGIAVGSSPWIPGNYSSANPFFKLFKQIKSKPVSHQILYGDNNDLGANGQTSGAYFWNLYHNTIGSYGPGTRHNGRGNYVWADGHTSSNKPSELNGSTDPKWFYNSRYYFYYWEVTPWQP